MLEQRNLKLDLAALALLALTVLLAVSLATYSPADPPSTLVYPAAAELNNACGRAGALVAALLLEGLGIGAYYLVLSLMVLDGALLGGRKVREPWLRGFGWGLSLAGLATLAALALPGWSPGPVIGAGGYLGATGRGLLEMHFASAGAYILVSSLIVGGLLLSTDYVLIRLSARLVSMPAKAVGRTAAVAGRTLRQRQRPNTMAARDETSAASGSLQVRIGRRRMEAIEDDDELQDDADELAESPDALSGEATRSIAEPRSSASQPRGGSRIEPRFKAPAKKSEREEVMEELDAASRTEDPLDYELPSIDLLLESEPFAYEEQEKEVRRKAKILEKTFASFGFNVKVVEIETGPVIAQFEVELEAGLRLSKITSLADDVAIALRVPSVRIVAPIPGKNTVGIEVPNAERQLVRLREVIEEANGKVQKMRIPIFLGKDVAGNPLVADLTSLPHLLIAGRTGTGKSVCLNTIIVSMLMTRRPDEVRMLLIDPKMVELSPYKTLPHLMHPVVTDMRKAEAILAWAVEKMEERYALLARAGVRHIAGYNQLGEEELMDRLQPESDEERKQIPTHLPYIVMVADEMADLMMTSAKEVETHIIRLAQKSRAVGIHLVLATQKPTVDVITGLIKSNLPARIAFQVASRTD
ncbi:MAG: DNA translocase FtsK 4TM domain-containing protein, partial [Pirellulales bacterium]